MFIYTVFIVLGLLLLFSCTIKYLYTKEQQKDMFPWYIIYLNCLFLPLFLLGTFLRAIAVLCVTRDRYLFWLELTDMEIH